jgi:hypothetical protein
MKGPFAVTPEGETSMMFPLGPSSGEDEEGEQKFSELFGPQQVDQSIRQALQLCWMSLPKERRNLDELEKQYRRMVDRALVNFREDRTAFGK